MGEKEAVKEEYKKDPNSKDANIKKQNPKKQNSINATTIGMAQSKLVQQHGEAASQMIQALKGTRYDSAGNDLGFQGRNLKQISNYSKGTGDATQQQKVVKSQAGFSAELLKEARDNKEAILKGDTSRTRTTDGLGKTNHTQYDHVKVDANGNVVDGSASQMKFYGVDQKGRYTVIEKLVHDETWDRYDKPIDVPSEQYENARKYAEDKAKDLREQAKKLRENGKSELAESKEQQAKKYENAKERIRKSNVSSDEATNARLNPEKFVAKEVIKDSHNAGIEAAKGAFIMSGSISTAQNLYAVIAEDKPLDEAMKDVAKTTASSGAIAYGVGASGTAIKSIMHSSNTEMVRRLGNTNVPAIIATSTVEVAKSMRKYAKGEIDEVELMEELGEKGTGMLASGFAASVGATIGGTIGSVVPVVGTALGATVGGFIGSLIGYSSSSMLYRGALDALKGEKISAERRMVLEELSRRAIEENERYKNHLKEFAQNQYVHREEVFSGLLSEIKDSIMNNDVDHFILAMNKVGNEFGVKMQFTTFDKIDEFMLDENTIFKL